MLDSIYIGVTGVRSHQTRINVIGNNVANINTVGFKGGRVTFSDVMGKTLSEGEAARNQVSATNPRQSGLGVEVASIDTVQRQGSLQSTGINTDLAIEGEGLFVLSNGLSDFYTRDGTFDFDSKGRLIDPATGLMVQGNLANEDGSFKTQVENLIIPFDRDSKAIASTRIGLSGNLDVSGSGQGEPVWSTSTVFGVPASLVSQQQDFNFTALGDNARMNITITSGNETIESAITVPAKNYAADRTALIADLNAQINVNGSLKGKVLFKDDAISEQIVLRTRNGGEGVTLSVDNPTGQTVDAVGSLGFSIGEAQLGAGVDFTASVNSLANVGADLTDGDVIRFSGTKPNGDRFDGNFTFDEATTSTVQDLLNAISDVYGGVEASMDIETGRLILTDNASQDRAVGFDINFKLIDNDSNTAGVSSGIFGNAPPFEFNTNTQVFDEKGDLHSLTVTFTKSVVANQWTWMATVDGVAPSAGGNGIALFNEDGTLHSFEPSDGSPLIFRPTGGAPDLNIMIEASSTDRLGGLTQFVAPSSVAVRDQDGRASGSLTSIDIESNGSVRGMFTNGDAQVLGRVSVAAFNNPSGLRRQGENMFVQTEASGQPVVGEAETTIQGSIRAGSIELSNVDLAEEFTNMIVTQRGFQASARSITTSDELLTELVNLKR
tara:strand:- start:1124 stop:3115 length:1992 start_codon:yes stop_codon:yes gene_type:complete